MITTSSKIQTITIVGAGNMAWHLCNEFTKAGLFISRIINRSLNSAKELAAISGTEFTTDFHTSNKDSQIIILAVNDSCITEVLNNIDISNNIVVHTSGSIQMNVISEKASHFGVFYPFQTLTRNIKTDFSEIPILTEASDDMTLLLIDDLASKISPKIFHIDSEQRKKLHLAGAISNNFINHLVTLTYDYLEKNQIDKKLILPLISETFKKLEIISPREAQTGPARRNNREIIRNHQDMLKEDPELKYLYNAISDSIIAYYFR